MPGIAWEPGGAVVKAGAADPLSGGVDDILMAGAYHCQGRVKQTPPRARKRVEFFTALANVADQPHRGAITAPEPVPPRLP